MKFRNGFSPTDDAAAAVEAGSVNSWRKGFEVCWNMPAVSCTVDGSSIRKGFPPLDSIFAVLVLIPLR